MIGKDKLVLNSCNYLGWKVGAHAPTVDWCWPNLANTWICLVPSAGLGQHLDFWAAVHSTAPGSPQAVLIHIFSCSGIMNIS
jgi:hypothetical protein